MFRIKQLSSGRKHHSPEILIENILLPFLLNFTLGAGNWKCFLKAVHLKVNYFQGSPWWERCVLSWPRESESFLPSLGDLTRSDLNLALIMQTSPWTLFLTDKEILGHIFWGVGVCVVCFNKAHTQNGISLNSESKFPISIHVHIMGGYISY